MTKQEAEKLAQIILKEIESPADIQKVYDHTEKEFSDHSSLIEFLSTKDRQHRKVFYLRSEEIWFRLYGWTMAKVLMLLGLLAGALFYLGRDRVDLGVALPFFIFGASAYYTLLYVFSINRYGKNRAKVNNIVVNYKSELKALLEELVKLYKLDGEKYKSTI